MKPLIFEFLETPTAEALDFSLIEYDPDLNLNVVKSTGIPAIDHLHIGTETFTRTDEVSDSESSRIHEMMSTETFTKVSGEESDPDTPSIRLLMATETITTSREEGSDHDIDAPPERYFFGRDFAAKNSKNIQTRV